MPPSLQALMETPLTLGAPPERAASLRAFLQEGRVRLRAAHDEGAPGRTVVRAWSRLVAKGVVALFDAAHQDAGGPPGVALAGVGGFGRLDLAPFSDVDLLLVHDPSEKEDVQRIADPFFTTLWDAKLEVGASVRTPEECAEAAAADHTIRTALLDCRYLAGDREVYQALENKVLRHLGEAQVDELVAAKVEEMRKRRERFGGSVHLLEPNVKQSPGGLRDLQAALWMARARFKAAGLSDLLSRGILPGREVGELSKARDFLWRLRNQLHHLAGRKEDHLTFHHQEQVAAALGYRDREGEGLAVEQFMRDYYLAASRLRRLADELAERCGPARLASGPPETWQVAPGLDAWDGRLTLESREALRRDPSLFVRLFTTAERMGVEVYGYARDLVRDEAAQLDPAVRSDPAVCAALVEALAKPGKAEWLRAMHREGVLGALVPEFGRITAKHQHDVYHVYTVDTHSIMAVQKLASLLAGELIEEEPELSLAGREISRPLGLVLGVLFHDAGKGLGGDHSVKGAELVRSVCARLGVSERDAANAEFLVREHLVMSHVSQRRDLSDPDLVEEFARRVGDRERLDMLYVLTFVDVSSVGPGTWTTWKGKLLGELHQKAAAVLEGRATEEGERSAHREALLGRSVPAERADAFLARMPRRYLSFADPRDALRSMRVLEMARTRPLATAVRDLEDATVLTLAAKDRQGLLADLAGVLAAHRIDVLRADVFSTTDGMALDVFSLRGPRGGRVERGRWRGARRDLLRVLEGEVDAEALVAKMLRPSGLPPRHVPPVRTKVKVDNRAARDFTVIDVFATDRRGLLRAITAALRQGGLSISVARIATEGNRAIDSFYVNDAEGRKLTDPSRLAAIEALVLGAVEASPGT